MKEKYQHQLLFGEEHSKIIHEISIVEYELSKIVPSLRYLAPIDNKNQFFIKTNKININDLKISTHIIAPSRVSSSEDKDVTLMIPLMGNTETIVENKKYLWGKDMYAYFKPQNEGKTKSKEIRCNIFIDINPNKFIRTAKIMFGLKDEEEFYFDFSQPRLIPLKYFNISFEIIIKHLANILDKHYDSLEDLAKAKFDDLIYRFVIMIIFPEKFFAQEELSKSRLTQESLSIIQLINQLKDEPLLSFMTLTDLEYFTGLSTRSLQLIFKKNFGITPVAFLREQKMKQAKKLIIESEGNINVTNIALEIGCYNFSQFAKYYKENFGETPSETIKKINHRK